jgi:hypothetical protein
VKHDLVALADLDGDLDAITTEEVSNLGVSGTRIRRSVEGDFV